MRKGVEEPFTVGEEGPGPQKKAEGRISSLNDGVQEITALVAG